MLVLPVKPTPAPALLLPMVSLKVWRPTGRVERKMSGGTCAVGKPRPPRFRLVSAMMLEICSRQSVPIAAHDWLHRLHALAAIQS